MYLRIHICICSIYIYIYMCMKIFVNTWEQICSKTYFDALLAHQFVSLFPTPIFLIHINTEGQRRSYSNNKFERQNALVHHLVFSPLFFFPSFPRATYYRETHDNNFWDTDGISLLKKQKNPLDASLMPHCPLAFFSHFLFVSFLALHFSTVNGW